MKKYFVFFIFITTYNFFVKAGGDIIKQQELLVALVKKNNNSDVEKLLKEGVNPDFVITDKIDLKYVGGVFLNELFERKITPLMLTAKMISMRRQDNIELVEMLLKHGASPFIKDAVGNTVLKYMAKKVAISQESSDYEEMSLKGFADAATQFPQNFVRQHSPEPHILKKGYNPYLIVASGNFSAGDWRILGKECLNLSSSAATALAASLVAVSDIGLAYELNHNIKQVKTAFDIGSQLHKEIVNVAQFVKQSKKLMMLAHNNKILSPMTDEIAMRFIASHDISKKLMRALNLLKTSTCNNYKSVLYSRGIVLVAHTLLQEVKEEMIPLFQVVGEIDALFSIATLYREFENQEKCFCFPEINSDTQPSIKLVNFWPALMNPEQAVINSMELGNAQTPNMLFSGPNGTGKSIAMKAVAQAILLFQSWGIAPAQSATITPFTCIETHMHPEENLAKNMSTFVAQYSKLLELHTLLQTGSDNDRFFLILDEPLNGTVEVEAAERVFNFGCKVAELNNCLVLMATHFEKPTTLHDTTLGKWSNVHLELHEEDKNFIPCFKLVNGKPEWWFTNEAGKRTRYMNYLQKTLS